MEKAEKIQAVTVVVRNLPAGTTEHQLRAICENLGKVVDVEIPSRTARFTKFIFGFVRFADQEAARIAVKELSGKIVGTRSLRAQIARGHWRNSNEDTVTGGGAGRMVEEHDEDLNMSDDEIHVAVLRECCRQWQQHCRRHPSKELPSFESILEAVCCLPSSSEALIREEEDIN